REDRVYSFHTKLIMAVQNSFAVHNLDSSMWTSITNKFMINVSNQRKGDGCKKKTRILVLLVSMLVLAGSSETNSSDQITDDSKQYGEAVQLFQRSQCIQCHGTDLQGKMGKPSNLSTIGSTMKLEEIIDVIAEGRDLMPA